MHVKYLKYALVGKLVDLGLTPSQIILANIIVSFGKEDKPLRAGYTKVGKLINVSGKTAQRDMDKLSVLGLVHIKSGKAQRNANEYRPTKKLQALYGQNVSINMDKLTNHTPKGYNKETPVVSLAKQHGFLKEYESDVENFNEEYAKRRLDQRIKTV